MPELSRFHGIIIRMFLEPGAPHHLPHFYAYYGGAVAVYRFIRGVLVLSYEGHRV